MPSTQVSTINTMVRIAVTSKSPIKIGAVRDALSGLQLEAEVNGFKTDSAVGDQPRGLEQTHEGAVNRIASIPRRDYDYIISIENGIHRLGAQWIDSAVVVIETKDGRRSQAESAGIPIPAVAVRYADNMAVHIGRGVKATTHTEANYCDPHAAITKGMWPRQRLLSQAITLALIPILSVEYEV
jgi:inosine/xanthosine triphosphatase